MTTTRKAIWAIAKAGDSPARQRYGCQQQPMPQQAPKAQQPAATIWVSWLGAAAKAAVEDMAKAVAAILSIRIIGNLSSR